MHVPPVWGDFGNNLVMGSANHATIATAETVDPALTGGQIAHLAVEHRDWNIRLINENVQQ
jgi:hypothetical protein